jgi:hypothetical protein
MHNPYTDGLRLSFRQSSKIDENFGRPSSSGPPRAKPSGSKFQLIWNRHMCIYYFITLAIKALRAAALVSGAFLLIFGIMFDPRRASGSFHNVPRNAP